MPQAEPAVFGLVASDLTVSRRVDTLAAGGEVIVDIDSMLVQAHSEKQDTAAT